nr:transposase [Pseudochelatococcus lubricantis]
MDDEKRSICFQTTAPGVSVAQVARRYAVNANLIFKWLRDARYAPDPAAVPSPLEEARFFRWRSSLKRRHRWQRPSLRATSRSNWLAATGCGSAAAMIRKPWRD